MAKDSPAWHAGVLGGDRMATVNGQELVVRGDIILDMDGIKIDSIDDLPRVREKMGTMKSGTPDQDHRASRRQGDRADRQDTVSGGPSA